MSPRRYGWRPQPEDHRDYRFAAPAPLVAELPAKVDLRPRTPLAYNQGRIGSCTANAIAGAIECCMIRDGKAPFTPSRLFIYWHEREMEGTVDRDAGAYIRDGMKVVNKVGAPAEKHWSYDDTPADPITGVFPADAKPRAKPSCWAHRYAKDADVISYLAVAQSVDQLRACLALGFPFIFGFEVYSSFESAEVARTGVVNLPRAGEVAVGGHAVLCVGYDHAEGRFIVRNSWGPDWGLAGHFTMPYEYLVNPSLASDFWTVRQV